MFLDKDCRLDWYTCTPSGVWTTKRDLTTDQIPGLTAAGLIKTVFLWDKRADALTHHQLFGLWINSLLKDSDLDTSLPPEQKHSREATAKIFLNWFACTPVRNTARVGEGWACRTRGYQSLCQPQKRAFLLVATQFGEFGVNVFV